MSIERGQISCQALYLPVSFLPHTLKEAEAQSHSLSGLELGCEPKHE